MAAIVRVLIYTEPQDWLNKIMNKSYVQGAVRLPNGAIIREALRETVKIEEPKDE